MSNIVWHTDSALGHAGLAQVDADEARERAEQILLRHEFIEPSPGWIQRALARLGEWLARILDATIGPIGEGGVNGAVGLVILIFVVGGIVFVIVRLAQRWQKFPDDSDEKLVSSRRESALSAKQWRLRAAEHEAAGEWAAAVRCHHRATVVDLAAKAGVVEAVGSTSGHWRDEAAARQLGDLEPITELFEGVWYGGEVAGSQDAKAASRDPFVGGK